jgi:hypothetical protein
MALSSADITRQIMQGGYRGMGGVNNIGRNGIDFSAYPYAHGPQVTQPANVPMRPLTPAGTAAPDAATILGSNPLGALQFGDWSVPGQVAQAYGAELQRLGLMAPGLVYNAETQTWAPPTA